MSSHHYEATARVLDAASAGETVPGFEAVGRVLVDLGRVRPLSPGMALRSPAVATATAASRGGLRRHAARLVRPAAVATAGVAAFVAVVVAVANPSSTAVTDGTPNPPMTDRVGVERVVDGATADVDPRQSPVTASVSDTSAASGSAPESSRVDVAGGPDGTTGSGPDSGAPTTNGPGESSSTTSNPTSTSSSITSTTTVDPTTTTVDPTTTTVDPTTTTVDPTTTTVDPTTTTTVQHGNNGNGNGNGTGNGKGNQGGGSSNSNGSGGPPDGD